MEQEANRNLEVMWLLERRAPDFKTTADFRRDNGPTIKKVCARFVDLCRQMGLLSKASVAIDGSRFKGPPETTNLAGNVWLGTPGNSAAAFTPMVLYSTPLDGQNLQDVRAFIVEVRVAHLHDRQAGDSLTAIPNTSPPIEGRLLIKSLSSTIGQSRRSGDSRSHSTGRGRATSLPLSAVDTGKDRPVKRPNPLDELSCNIIWADFSRSTPLNGD